MSKKNIVYRGKFNSYNYELTFDFKEEESSYEAAQERIKEIGGGWINEYLLDATIKNPKDSDIITLLDTSNSKTWQMCLEGTQGNCPASIENLAKELFLVMAVLFEFDNSLQIHLVTLVHPEEGFATCVKESITASQAKNWLEVHYDDLKQYKTQ